MGVASGCGEQEVGVASGSGLNLWVWLVGVVVRRYITGADLGGALAAEGPPLLGYHLLQKSIYVFIITNLYPLCTC